MKRFALLLATGLFAVPAAAQVATVPAPSLSQAFAPDTTLTVSVSLFGYTTKSQVPHLLSKQTVQLPAISLLQPEVRAEFPGLPNVGMTVMQLVMKATADAPTFHSQNETIAPKQPLKISVPAGKKVWVIYATPNGQQPSLRFYVGDPPPATATHS